MEPHHSNRPDLTDDDAVLRIGDLRTLRQDFTRFMMRHRFGMEEVVTKLTILRDEFALMHETNPIEHIASRLKTPDSLAEKMKRKGTKPTFSSITTRRPLWVGGPTVQWLRIVPERITGRRISAAANC